MKQKLKKTKQNKKKNTFVITISYVIFTLIQINLNPAVVFVRSKFEQLVVMQAVLS